MKEITKTLLRFESYARKFFEQYPFLQALLAGIGVIIFWRGIWEWLDDINVSPFSSIIIGAIILFGVGAFLQTFIGNTIIIKNVEQEEKIEKKVLKDIVSEEKSEDITLSILSKKIDLLISKLDK
ncbi:MAG: hypothetical protein KBC17_03890 [Candidatus Pacebacteria bacterium]|nr:hypothetical protein [Candidatus Paceibacterota bacterium]